MFRITVIALQLRVLRGQFVDLRAKRMHAVVARRVDEVHGTLAAQGRRQHGQGRRDAYAAADQHQRFVAVFQHEVARWRRQLYGVASLHVVVEMVRHLAARFALDADAVGLAIAGGRQGILAAHGHAIDGGHHADVLAGRKVEHGLAIGGRQQEGRDLAAFHRLAAHGKVARAAPAARRGRLRLVDAPFFAGQDVGQLAVGRAPGIDDRVAGDLCAQHFADRLQQAGTDQRIVLGADLQGHMLVDDGGHEVTQRIQFIDMFGIHQHAIGQRALLVAAVLVRLVKVRQHFRMVAEQVLVEVARQRFAALLEDGHGGRDDGALFLGQHVKLLWGYG
ncbi:hypothetical protein D3C72_1084030 [compost metagenome]